MPDGPVVPAMAASREGSRIHSTRLALSGAGVKAPACSGSSAMPVMVSSPAGPGAVRIEFFEESGTKPRLTAIWMRETAR